jgi:hypothetical protein
MATTDAEIKLQVLLQILGALAFLSLAGFCLARRREGTWALLGLCGAVLIGLANGLLAASSFEFVFLDSFHIAEEILIREHINTVLALGTAGGAVMIAAAFVVLHRAMAAASSGGSIYGP